MSLDYAIFPAENAEIYTERRDYLKRNVDFYIQIYMMIKEKNEALFLKQKQFTIFRLNFIFTPC